MYIAIIFLRNNLKMRNSGKLFKSLVILFLGALIFNQGLVRANNNTDNSESSNASECKNPFKLFCPPPENVSQEGAPRGRRSAGTRSDCPGITALVPEPKKNQVLGLTAVERPTFWFALDFPSETNLAFDVQLKFVMVDREREEDIVDLDISLPEQPGIISVPLTESEPALEVGKRYGWRLECIASSGNRKSAYGWIDRVALNPAVSVQLQAASSEREQISIYGENGLWYETVTALGEMYEANPQDDTIQTDWLNLLTNIELAELAEQPILP